MIDDAIQVYVDGSYAPLTNRSAYGWVAKNAVNSMLPARVVEVVLTRASRPSGTQMEAAAFIDAVAEFAPRQKPIVVYGDCRALAMLIEKWRRGEVSTEAFYDAKWLRPEDRGRLLPLLSTVEFSFQWVRALSAVFHNAVVDQMLRKVTVDGMGERLATAYAISAMETGLAEIYDTALTKTPQSHHYHRISRHRVLLAAS